MEKKNPPKLVVIPQIRMHVSDWRKNLIFKTLTSFVAYPEDLPGTLPLDVCLRRLHKMSVETKMDRVMAENVQPTELEARMSQEKIEEQKSVGRKLPMLDIEEQPPPKKAKQASRSDQFVDAHDKRSEISVINDKMADIRPKKLYPFKDITNT